MLFQVSPKQSREVTASAHFVSWKQLWGLSWGDLLCLLRVGFALASDLEKPHQAVEIIKSMWEGPQCPDRGAKTAPTLPPHSLGRTRGDRAITICPKIGRA